MTTRRGALRSLLPLLLPSAGLPSAFGAEAVKRIGILSESAAEASKETLLWEPEFWAAMARHGWVVGRNVVVERALAETRLALLPRLAEELVSKRVDLILCYGDPEAMAVAARATRTIPILVFDVPEPVAQGLVDSLARPGRNVTGISLGRGTGLALKRLQYLRAIAPSAQRLCWLHGGGPSLVARVDGSRYDSTESLVTAARTLQFDTRVYAVASASEVESALADAVAWGAQALLGGGYPVFLAREQVVEFALRQGWPSAFAAAEFVRVGGLLSLSVADAEADLLTERWVNYVDRVLRGTKPAEMPVISADRFELQINTKTAEALGLTIPRSVLLQADGLVR